MSDQALFAPGNKRMDDGTQRVHEALIAQGKISMGVGKDAMKQLGLTGQQISERIMQAKLALSDGAASFIDIAFPVKQKTVRLYVRRQGRFLDAGTRADFREMGWERICNKLDLEALVLS